MEPLKRVTGPTVDVLTALLQHDGSIWGLLIIRATGRPAGTIYPILERLETCGWIESSWEADDARPGPRRRLYAFTSDGRAAAIETKASYVQTRLKSPAQTSIRPATA
jgi:PadR family transcriptional regulator PadR